MCETTEIKDETEMKAVVVINQRAYEVPREVKEYIEWLRRQDNDRRLAAMDLQDELRRERFAKHLH